MHEVGEGVGKEVEEGVKRGGKGSEASRGK